ncbi:MAG: potassium channel protein [Bacteroidota bacterium]|nr:potassium channel protein [Bacteroidota bacterium]
MPLFRRFIKVYYVLALLTSIIFIGVLGFIIIEGYSFSEALYMTFITISTTGFSEVRPLSGAGRYFTVFLIFISFGTFAYGITALSNYIMDGELRKYFNEYKEKKMIGRMENHIIVCGYGRNGKQATIELAMNKHPFIVVEEKKVVIENSDDEHPVIFVEGDATKDDILLKAGVQKAKAIITTLPIDADNLYVVLSARSLNPKIKIISRASNESSFNKLKIAGADNIIFPEKIGGAHMASLVVKPDVVEFFNLITVQEGIQNTNLEEIMCNNLPVNLRNKTINELGVRSKSGANIIGFKTPEGEYVINPSPDTIMMHNAKLFVLGTPEQILIMKEMIGNK